MTIFLQYKLTPTASWTDFDLGDGVDGQTPPGNGVAIQQVLFSYSQASRLDFTVTAAEQTTPLPRGAFVLLWDDVGLDESGAALSASNPLFVGSVMEITPGSHSNEVVYVAMDPTYIASKGCTVMSLPYTTGGVPATGAVPRLVYNVKNTSDDDYAFEAGQNATVGGILQGLLDYTVELLRLSLAAPASGVPYNSGDFASMTFIPQEKMVWESQTIRSALEQVWRFEPRFRMFFHPRELKWNFYQLNNPGVTPYVNLSLNDTGLVNDYPVIGLDINPSFENCFTAVSITGPPDRGMTSFYWDTAVTSPGNTNLEPIGSPTILQPYTDSMGSHNAETWLQWRIHDTTQRAGGRILPTITTMETGNGTGFQSKYPTFLASWDMGTTWVAVKGVVFDFLNGSATFTGPAPYTEEFDFGVPVTPPGSTQTKFPPNAFKLYWAPYLPPLQARYPSSGYAGTAFTDYGCEEELRLYDESLAIGYEYGTPVTSATRLAQYAVLAENLQSVRCDIIFTGTIVLAGCDYSWCRLNRQVNLVDAAGSTTGWESMFAPVTDVEYTYGDQPSTTLTFNANWLELYGQDPAALREKLRIQSFSQYTFSQMYGMPINTYSYNRDGTLSGVNSYNPFVYRDQYGHVTTAGIS